MTRIAIVHKEKLRSDVEMTNMLMGVCPVNRTGKQCIKMGSDSKPSIDPELCIGCGICVKKAPEGAISIINLPESLKEDPIHNFGENGFHLYSLPTPLFGKVVGIVGRNGIGKTTAINILSGNLRPNLGKENSQAGVNDLIEYFKGTETQMFFENLRDEKIYVSVKPQHVDLIPKKFKGKVRELLEKVDQKNQLDDVAKQLDIFPILDNEVSQVSGGELQRVAIAACALKKANLYIFDEPTSYLDIKQRLKIAQFIRNLVDDNTAVMLIEHDLIALDYIADVVHIMYGEEACYGIVSLPKTIKAGINIYLEGYLKEENVRFRDKSIRFDVKAPSKSTKAGTPISQWKGIKKKLGSFDLEAPEGKIGGHQIIGVLGENGIGKTTFIKILAHEIKADEGDIQGQVTVSYKPQYLNSESDILVRDYIMDAITGHLNDIVVPLRLKELYDRKICDLSGGELQRVEIARALGQDCDLVLMDEPSAYLDVEQRLLVSKIIGALAHTKGISVLVVDHDLLFLDYLSQAILVFDGIPTRSGRARGPLEMEDGFNALLKEVAITLRRDHITGRPRINKLDSQKDREQKSSGKYYYT